MFKLAFSGLNEFESKRKLSLLNGVPLYIGEEINFSVIYNNKSMEDKIPKLEKHGSKKKYSEN